MEAPTKAVAVTLAAQHAARGAGASLAALLALANALGNRRAVVRALTSLDASGLRLRGPSRTISTVAVFVGAFRFVQRLIAVKKTHGAAAAAAPADGRGGAVHGAVPASVVASVLATLCLPPKNRPAVVSLLSTNALSLLFRDVVAQNPQLAGLAPLELGVFMAACGWIYYSGFFHPDSYDKSHMNLLLKYTLLKREAANALQDQYALGENPNPCAIRHPGQSCRRFYTTTDFFQRVIELGLRVYLPVHLMSLAAGMRSAKMRAMPPLTLASTLAARLSRSVAYFFGFVGIGWTFSCLAGPVGDRSLAMRKLQFFVCGSLPSVALLFELPSRRRPIGVILTSYVLVSVASVVSEHIPWLQRRGGSSAARVAIEVTAVAAAVAYTISGSLSNSSLLRRVLLAQSLPKERPAAAKEPEAAALQQKQEQALASAWMDATRS